MKKKSTIKHAPMTQFKNRQGELLVNGISISQLKSKVGQTPFYAYDKSIIQKKIQNFKQLMPSDLQLHYAIKANPMAELVNFVAEQVDGLDVASVNELNIALNSGTQSSNISFAGPAKRPIELAQAVSQHITINVESFTELDRIFGICQQSGQNANVAVRVNPNFELKSSGMKMGGGSQQFGIDSELVPQMLKKISDYGLNFRGFHIFTGSQNLNSDSIVLAHQNIFELATQLQQSHNQDIHSLNIGGGLGIPYFPGEKPLSLEPIAAPLEALMKQFKNEFGETIIAMELGRYLVGDSGIYVAEVVDIKDSRGTTFALLDGGLHHHLSASGNFGQVIRKNYPVAIANKMEHPIEKTIQIVGPLCTPLDVMANQYELPHAEIGDIVAIFQSGAYGYTASPRDFLDHPQPIEILV